MPRAPIVPKPSMGTRRALRASPEDQDALKKWCQGLDDVHVWRGNSPEPREKRPKRVKTARYNVDVLGHRSSIRLVKREMKAAGLSYLRSKWRSEGGTVRVKPRGTYGVSRFRGVLWVGGVCVAVGDNSYQILRVCGYEKIVLTYTTEAMYTERSNIELCDWSATGKATRGRLLSICVQPDKGCLRTSSNLSEAYADLVQPAHDLIYASPFPGVDHPVALRNRAGYPVCPVCMTVFHSTQDLGHHLGLKKRWTNMSWKPFSSIHKQT